MVVYRKLVVINIEVVVSEIFGVSFDVLSSPTLKVNNKEENSAELEADQKSPWGIAWYPNDGYAASVVKDITNNTAKNFSRLLSNWDNFLQPFFYLGSQANTKYLINTIRSHSIKVMVVMIGCFLIEVY